MDIPAMSIRFFSGGAGCGKTYQVMKALNEHIQANPLTEGQKVLALTFMHGSRRRLHERLGQLKDLAGRFECMVIDSLAWRVVSRWQALLNVKGRALPPEGDFEGVCKAAALLLNDAAVGKWLAATFPVFILDEAQDLNAVRLDIVTALAGYITTIAAADEFQCLDEGLRPNPAFSWLEENSNMEWLEAPQRTNVAELLEAAHAIRAGQAPVSGKFFHVVPTANAGLAGTYLSNQIGWYGVKRDVAIITTVNGPFSRSVTTWVGGNTTKKGNGPYQLTWELSEQKAIEAFLSARHLPDSADATHFYELINAVGDDRATRDVHGWLDTQRRTKGRVEFKKEEIIEVICRSFANRKYGSSFGRQSLFAMTVHGAKNREFDNVIVLWPAATRGDDEHLRRLLYNAVTRAKSRCLVLVQAQASLGRAPFA